MDVLGWASGMPFHTAQLNKLKFMAPTASALSPVHAVVPAYLYDLGSQHTCLQHQGTAPRPASHMARKINPLHPLFSYLFPHAVLPADLDDDLDLLDDLGSYNISVGEESGASAGGGGDDEDAFQGLHGGDSSGGSVF